jgi:hypothetical protein
MPLRELWDDLGPVQATRSSELTIEDIRSLLRQGPLRFVVANCGHRPRWVAEKDRFSFWKSEVQAHLADPDTPASLEDFPGEYSYFASLWAADAGTPIVQLEMQH